jgi:hypothetical protein
VSVRMSELRCRCRRLDGSCGVRSRARAEVEFETGDVNGRLRR